MAADRRPLFQFRLSVKGLRGELTVCCEMVVRGLLLLNQICGMRLEKLFEELDQEYRQALGGENDANAS